MSKEKVVKNTEDHGLTLALTSELIEDLKDMDVDDTVILSGIIIRAAVEVFRNAKSTADAHALISSCIISACRHVVTRGTTHPGSKARN